MPVMDLTSENKRNATEAFPKMMLDHDERKRIVLLEKAPTVQYVHTLRAPQIDEQGKPVMTVQKARRAGQEDRVVNAMDFIGRHICLGTFAVLQEKGADPDNCPTCAAAKKSDAIAPADRRFAINVGEYATKPGTFTVREPFSMEITVWTFGDQIFNKLVDLTGEWGDLRERDLNLGPCIQKQFQRFDIAVAASAAWLESEQRRAFVGELYQSSRCTDLEGQIARKTPRQFIEEDIAKVLERTRIAQGVTDEKTPEQAATESAALDALLGETTTATVVDQLTPAQKERALAKAEAETGVRPVDLTSDLDSLLGDDKPVAVITPEGQVRPVKDSNVIEAKPRTAPAEDFVPPTDAEIGITTTDAAEDKAPAGDTIDLDALLS